MKKHLPLLLLLLLLSTLLFSQASINGAGSPPDSDAGLDISFPDKGFLPPRIALSSTSSASPLSAHVEGMVVYNTATAGDVLPGLYVNDGSQWVALTPSTGSDSAHYLGENFGGGIVYFVTDGGQHGLIATASNVGGTVPFSNVNATQIGASAASFIDGQTNTAAIISQPGHTTSAANVCATYSGGGYTDWYLPAREEFIWMCTNRYIIDNFANPYGGFTWNEIYHTSTEHTDDRSYASNPSNDCTANSNGKSSNGYVRCIRKF